MAQTTVNSKDNIYMIIHKKYSIILLISILITFIAISCAQNINVENKTISQKMTLADTLYNQGKFNQAKDIYEIITFEGKGDTLVKRAQFQLANSYYNLDLYEDAIFEYKQFVRLFPFSKFSEEANFRTGQCYYLTSYPPEYDQERTIMAINKLKEFKSNYPNSERISKANQLIKKCINKLLEKKYQNAFIYYRLDDYNASLMYLEEIINDSQVNDKILKKSLVLMAKIHMKEYNKNALEGLLIKFNNNFPKHTYKKIIEKFLNEE